jgi:signal transduction histidine kinase
MANLRQRAQAIRAQLDINSAPGQGTTIKITLPLPADHIIIR